MNSRQMEYVLAVAEEHSFSKAAKRLVIAQPSLSQYIQNVEKELGMTLFDRSSSPLQLTQAGEIYVKTVRNILDIENQMQEKLADLADLKTGRFYIGISPYLSTYLMPIVFSRFYELFPGVDINLIEDITSELEGRLLRGEIELALTTFPKRNNPKLEYISILREDLLLAVPEKFCGEIQAPYEIKGGHWPTTDLQNFKNIPFVTLKSDQMLYLMTMDLCKQVGFEPKIRLECRNLESAHAMANAGIGATLLPYTLARPDVKNKKRQVRYYRLAHLYPERELVAVYRKERYLTKALQSLIQITQEIAENVTNEINEIGD